MLEGKHHGLLQLIRALHLGNPHRRTGIAGLDKDRETAQLDGDLHLQVEQRGNCSLAHAEPVGSLDAGGIQDDVGVLLIHADGAGADIGAHAGDPGQVAEALHRAVLGKAAVHHREHGIQPGGLRLARPEGSPDHALPGSGERKAGRLPLSSSQEWSMSLFTSPV